MNVLGHTHVARAWGAHEPAVLLGAVLPDLASIARVRIDRSALSAALADGVRYHIRADAAFHRLRPFLAGSAAIAAELADAGLPRGAARAVGHVGWELLLDGTLLDTPAADDCDRALGVADRATRAVAAPDRVRWARLLARRGRGQPPYDDPGWVAERLHDMLADRPRLAFPREMVDAVAGVLTRHAPLVAEAGPAVLAATVAAR